MEQHELETTMTKNHHTPDDDVSTHEGEPGALHSDRFDFDGAEGIAFWVNKLDEAETSIPILFDELLSLRKFLERNLPGLFGGYPEPQERPEIREATISHSDARVREIALSVAAQGRQFADGHTVIADAELYRQFLTGTEPSVEIEGHRFTFEQAEAIENYVQYRLEDARTNDRLNRSEP